MIHIIIIKDKDLEKKFRHGAKFLLKVLWDHTERNTIKFKWLQGCIAHKVQYPAVTVQQCLAINGKKKCGKNTIYRTLAKDIFKDYGLIKQNLNGLTGRFNTDLCNKVVVVYDEGVDNVINSIRPLIVDGKESNLTATEIIRENDAYQGYPGNENVQGNMSRADAVMVLVKALANATKDPNKKNTMIKTALNEYSKGNIVMKPEGSFTRLLATKGFESLTS